MVVGSEGDRNKSQLCTSYTSPCLHSIPKLKEHVTLESIGPEPPSVATSLQSNRT